MAKKGFKTENPNKRIAERTTIEEKNSELIKETESKKDDIQNTEPPKEEPKKLVEDTIDNTTDKTDETNNIKPEKEKGKPGRKITKDVKHTCRNINVAIPNELLDKWNEIKKAKGNNLTQYVTDLIQKDMDENYEKYKQAVDILNNL